MQKVLLTLLCLALYCPIQAQVTTETTVKPNSKWEIGIDLLRFVDLNTVPKNSIFLRHNLNAHGALRSRIGFEKDTRTYDQQIAAVDTYRVTTTYLSLGYEWQRNMHKWRFFTALDAFGEQHYENNYLLISCAGCPGNAWSLDTITQLTLGAIGTVGFQYQVYKNLHLSYEMSLKAFHTNSKYDSRELNWDGSSNATSRYYWKQNNVAFHPISTFQLIFTIPKKIRT